MSDMVVPGYDVVELLGFGAGGEVWLAREAATGSPVALKRVRDAGDVEARARLEREAAVLAGVRHPHVVRLRGVVGDGDTVVLVLDLAAGGSLARLLTSRRTLTPGEVVTVGVPLAQALSVIHGQGLVHGDVSPANVLFAGDGRPQLSDLGMSRLLGAPAGAAGGTGGYLDPAVQAGGAATTASDVLGLAATCWAALTGSAPFDVAAERCSEAVGTGVTAEQAAVLTVLEQAMSSVPSDRPTADQLASLLFRAARSAPVHLEARGGLAPLVRPRWLPGDDSPALSATPTHVVARPVVPVAPGATGAGRRRRSRPRRRSVRRMAPLPRKARLAVVGLLGAAAVAGAAVTGVAWAGADDDVRGGHVVADPGRPHLAVSSPVVAPSPAAGRLASDWEHVLGQLDDARGAAFEAADPTGLPAVYVSGSPALARDRRTLLALRGSGLRAVGVRLRMTSVFVAARSSREVRLRVSDSMPAYRLVTAAGLVREQHPGRGVRQWTVVLRVRPGGAWGVYDVLRG